MSSSWPPQGEWQQPHLHLAKPIVPPTEPPPTDTDLGETAFREAVVALTTSVADDLQDVRDRDEARQVIRARVQRWAQEQIINDGPLSFATQRRLVDAVEDERYEVGVLTPYVRDRNVESIDINGCDQVLITYNDGSIVRGPALAPTDADMINMLQMWALHKSYAPREFSSANPLLRVALRPGHEEEGVGVRLTATMEVTRRPHASIRCQHLVDIDLDDMLRYRTISRSLYEFLRAAVRARLNIVITGGTSAGKTTMLRALTSVIDPMERIATLESDYELFLDELPHRHSNVIAFQVRQENSEGVGSITLNDLIPHSLRKNIKRIFVGEVLGDEIVAMFEAMNTGHPGSMCTIHADGTEELFNRIVMLWTRGSRAATPPSIIHLNTGETIDLVVHLHRDGNVRFVSEVLEVLPPADSELPSRNHVYRSTGQAGRAMPDITPQCLSKLMEAGFDPALLDPRNAGWEVS